MSPADLAAEVDRRAMLDLLNMIHGICTRRRDALADDLESYARNRFLGPFSALERAWQCGNAPRPGETEWPLWYDTERADATEAINTHTEEEPTA